MGEEEDFSFSTIQIFFFVLIFAALTMQGGRMTLWAINAYCTFFVLLQLFIAQFEDRCPLILHNFCTASM